MKLGGPQSRSGRRVDDNNLNVCPESDLEAVVAEFVAWCLYCRDTLLVVVVLVIVVVVVVVVVAVELMVVDLCANQMLKLLAHVHYTTEVLHIMVSS